MNIIDQNKNEDKRKCTKDQGTKRSKTDYLIIRKKFK